MAFVRDIHYIDYVKLIRTVTMFCSVKGVL